MHHHHQTIVIHGSTRRLTLGAEKGCETADFVGALRQMCVTPAETSHHDATTKKLGRVTDVLFGDLLRSKV